MSSVVLQDRSINQDYLYLDSGALEGVVKHGQNLCADVVPGSFLQDYVQVLQ